MKRLLAPAALALASTMFSVVGTSAHETRYSELAARLTKIEAQLATAHRVEQASYSDCGSCDACCTDCCAVDCCSGACCGCSSCGAVDCYYAEVQMNFLRAHVLEGSIIGNSKFSEEYELSPRFVAGYENCCGQGFRVRYWHHGHHHNNLNGPGGARFEMDVLDLELTKRFSLCRTDVVLAGGFRGADVGVVYGAWNIQSDNTLGLTAAMDVRTLLCCSCSSEWAAVYGGRLAILGSDMDGGPQGLVRDVNWRVWELYAGAEYRYRCCGTDVYTRFGFEMQNWHVDQMQAEVTPILAEQTSLGFVGPTWTIGASF